MNYNQQPPRFISYWLGFRSEDSAGKLTATLEDTPDCVDVVVLAFALVRPGNIVDTSFICRPPNTDGSILEGVRALRRRGKKVLLSVGGWGGNCWGSVTDVNALTASIMRAVNQWELDGVDLDYEGDQPLDDWMKTPACPDSSGSGGDPVPALIPELRSQLGPKRMLTLVTDDGYDPNTILDLNWVATMQYGDSSLYDAMVSQYLQSYPNAQVLPFSLGVSCAGPQMSLDDVTNLCGHKPQFGPLRMMFWDLSEDGPSFTSLPQWSYVNAINANLPEH